MTRFAKGLILDITLKPTDCNNMTVLT